jgi:MFS family permease
LPILLVLALIYGLTLIITGRHRDAVLLSVLMGLMSLTATSEFGTQQWVERILGGSGAQPMLILAMVTGIMAVGRFFAGPLIKALNPVGVLLASAVVTTLGLFMMTTVSGGLIYLAAIFFALGICYFWPTMIAVTALYAPRSGALGMSLVGAAGMFAMTIWNPAIGGWIDTARKTAEESGLTGAAVDVAAGQGALSKLVLFPIILIVCFLALYLVRNRLLETAEPIASEPMTEEG